MDNKNLGIFGEELVTRYLIQKKFKILARNYTTRYGEVDIIAQKDDYLIFVEVKTRHKEYFPIATVVTKSKQQKICTCAKNYIWKNNVVEKICRFDVATVVIKGNQNSINYIENAFYGK